MAKFVFTWDAQEYPLDANRLTFGESDAIERFTGLTMVEWNKRLNAGSSRALQALVGVAIKRKRPTFTYRELDTVAPADIDVQRLDPDPAPEAEGAEADENEQAAALPPAQADATAPA